MADLKRHIEKVVSVRNSIKQDATNIAKDNVETQMIEANYDSKEISNVIDNEVDIINKEFNTFRLEEF